MAKNSVEFRVGAAGLGQARACRLPKPVERQPFQAGRLHSVRKLVVEVNLAPGLDISPGQQHHRIA